MFEFLFGSKKKKARKKPVQHSIAGEIKQAERDAQARRSQGTIWVKGHERALRGSVRKAETTLAKRPTQYQRATDQAVSRLARQIEAGKKQPLRKVALKPTRRKKT